MKNFRILNGALGIAAVLSLTPLALSQTSVTTTAGGGTAVVSTSTSAGTISEFSPDTIIVRSETSPEPIRYSYSKTTTYVDETGAPVSRELVKSGLPVTVHYVKEGDRMIANRVVVRRTTTAVPVETGAVIEKRVVVPQPPAVIEEKKTTTTTTIGK
jgi:hypothetical protein